MIRARVAETLELVRMAGYGERYPRQLSGGQQQRVAIARAIIFNPRVLLMDEPLSALDKKLREDMQLEIKSLHRRLGITFVYVTHDQHEALVMSDRIVVMNEGRIEQVGTPDAVYDRPATRFVASFIGEGNFLNGAVVGDGAGGAVLRTCGAALRGVGEVRGTTPALMVRPEKISVGTGPPADPARNALAATVRDVAFVGEVRRYLLQADDGTLLSAKEQHRFGQARHEAGARVVLHWAVEDTLVV